MEGRSLAQCGRFVFPASNPLLNQLSELLVSLSKHAGFGKAYLRILLPNPNRNNRFQKANILADMLKKALKKCLCLH